MKGLILSGGHGTRLRPITYTSAKQLVPVANKPILFYGIETLVKAGIKEIGIVVGDTATEIKAACGTGRPWGVKITYIEQDRPRGLAHAVLISEPFIKDDKFVMFLGDNIVKDGLTEFVREFSETGANAHILLARVKDPQEYGVAELKGKKVVKLVEKPKKPASDLALVGAYLFDSNIFKAARAIKPSGRGELEITDAIQYLIDHKLSVHPHIIKGWWKDTGRLEDLLEANRIMLDIIEPSVQGKLDKGSEVHGRVQIGKGTVIKSSTVRGPVIIGTNCRIENAYIGPFTSIENNVEIVSGELEHSIILSDCKILNIKARIEDSLLGRNVKIHCSNRKPKAFRFMIGDNSDVEVIC